MKTATASVICFIVATAVVFSLGVNYWGWEVDFARVALNTILAALALGGAYLLIMYADSPKGEGPSGLGWGGVLLIIVLIVCTMQLVPPQIRYVFQGISPWKDVYLDHPKIMRVGDKITLNAKNPSKWCIQLDLNGSPSVTVDVPPGSTGKAFYIENGKKSYSEDF